MQAASRTIDLIVLHCSATRPSQDFTLAKLTACHRARGFGQYPGYHLYIRRDGTLHYCRPVALKGCHVAGHNAHSIGVCYEGGGDFCDDRTAEQLVTLHNVLALLHELLPNARICGHHDLNPAKACPCLDPPPSIEYAYIFDPH